MPAKSELARCHRLLSSYAAPDDGSRPRATCGSAPAASATLPPAGARLATVCALLSSRFRSRGVAEGADAVAKGGAKGAKAEAAPAKGGAKGGAKAAAGGKGGAKAEAAPAKGAKGGKASAKAEAAPAKA